MKSRILYVLAHAVGLLLLWAALAVFAIAARDPGGPAVVP